MARMRGGRGTPIRVSRIEGGSSGTRGDLSGAVSSLMAAVSLVGCLLKPAATQRLKALYNDDLRFLVRSTCDQACVNFPIFSGFGQFRRHILSLGKQPQGAFAQQRIRKREQLRQRR